MRKSHLFVASTIALIIFLASFNSCIGGSAYFVDNINNSEITIYMVQRNIAILIEELKSKFESGRIDYDGYDELYKQARLSIKCIIFRNFVSEDNLQIISKYEELLARIDEFKSVHEDEIESISQVLDFERDTNLLIAGIIILEHERDVNGIYLNEEELDERLQVFDTNFSAYYSTQAGEDTDINVSSFPLSY